MTPSRFLGVTVLADFVLSEGVEPVLDRLTAAGVNAVATNPTVTAPAPEGHGSFQPPSDAGASVREFDRPLWGRKALWVRSGPSFAPRPELYGRTPYAPRQANDLTASRGAVVAEFVGAAKARGMRVYFQVGAVQPPGLREEDLPRLPDGRLPVNRMAETGSLASEAIREYNRAYVQDLLDHYPEIDGLRVDWPEYPCYQLDEAFQDFGAPARDWIRRHGGDPESLTATVGALYQRLHGGLGNDDLRRVRETAPRGGGLAGFDPDPRVQEWLTWKARLSEDLLRDWRAALDSAGGRRKELSANAFMPPFSRVTGLAFDRAAAVCGSVSAKLYTMHWALMVRFWGGAILSANPELDEELLVETLVHLLDLDEPDGERPLPRRLSTYEYPPPDQPHPIPDGPQRRKLEQVVREVEGRCRVYALVHGYGPPTDFQRRLQVAAESSVDGIWINRYGYLSDEKLRMIGEGAP